MIELRLTQLEQDALAAMAQAAASVHWQYFGKGEEATSEQLEAFADVVLKFNFINWGTVYDKLHRSGANS